MSLVAATTEFQPEIVERIQQQLDQIERQHRVQILYACESGSRAWGFASPDSDYDVRFLYLNPAPWYLSIRPQRDHIELPIDAELDINGWDLRKALQLLHQCNPSLGEWLASPWIYRQRTEVIEPLRALARQYYCPDKNRWHYWSMANKNFRGYLQGERVQLKKYLYVLRPLLAVRWIEARLGPPPIRFNELVAATVQDPGLMGDIDQLLLVKQASGERQEGPRLPRIHQFITAELSVQPAPLTRAQPSAPDALDRFLFEQVWAQNQG